MKPKSKALPAQGKREEKKENAAAEFRADLNKLLPGYKWTVKKSDSHEPKAIYATGIQSSGFNRLSTLDVKRTLEGSAIYPWHEIAGYGHGTRADRMGRGAGITLANAVRCLQDHYAHQAAQYQALHNSLEAARKETPSPAVTA